MKKSFLILLALLVMGSSFAQKAPSTKLISSTEKEIVVNFQLNGYTVARVQTPQGDQLVVSAPKMASMLEAGAPDLPMYPIPAIIGDRAEMTVNVIDAEYTDYPNMEIAPCKGNFSRQINPEDVPYTYGAMYQEDAFWPATPAYLESPYILRDFRGQNIMVRPFAYNPVTKTLRVYTSMTIAMTKVSDNGVNQKAARKSNDVKVDPETKAQYGRRFINFGATETKYTFIEDAGELLIICPDQYMEDMTEFVNWKNQSGRPTTLVSLTEAGGNNDNNIKNYITEFYNDPEHNLGFILLIGEYTDLTPHSMNNGRSDNWFGMMEGNDYYPEILVGRFSIQNATQLQTHINKVLYFERDMPEDVDWVDKGLGIGYYGAGSGHFGEDDYQHIDLIRDTLLHYTYTQVTEHHGGSGGTASQASISGTINDGVSIINYCNHGSETSWGVANYSTSNVNALTNDNKLPVVWSVACLNGKFDVGECFGESWLRATNNSTGAPTGAVGGMFSWISQPWIPPMYGQDEMIDIFTEWHSADEFHHTLGGASLNGSMYILDAAPSDGGNTHNTWLLFGDPSLVMRSANPTSMNLTLNPPVPMIGMTSLDLSVSDTPYAFATLSNEDGVIATAEIVDGNGTLEFTGLSAVETLTLTVMAYNRVTEVIPMEVLPNEGPFVTVNGFTPNIGAVNHETPMSMSFKNVGADPTTSVTTVTLSCADDRLQIVDGEAEFDVLGVDEVVSLENAFSFFIDESVDDGTKFQIDVTMENGRETWAGKAIITAGKAILAYNGNAWEGSFVPGEEVELIAYFTNKGHYMATNAICSIACDNEYVTLLNNDLELGTIDPDGLATCVFHIAIDANCPESEQIPVTFTMTADEGASSEGSVTLKNTCNVIFELADDYGDGWNGASLTVSFSDGTPSQNITVPSGGSSATYTFEVGNMVQIHLSWNTGSWDGECSFVIKYETGEVIYQSDGLGSGWTYDFVCSCSGVTFNGDFAPVENIAYSVTDHTVTLTWDAPADAIGYYILRNGVVIGTSEAPTFDDEIPYEVDYTYCVVAEYELGVSNPECVILKDLLFIGEEEAEFAIYPNPVENILYVNCGNADFSYVLYNGMGQQVANGTAQGSLEINVNGLTSGVYFLHLTSGSQATVQKVIVK